MWKFTGSLVPPVIPVTDFLTITGTHSIQEIQIMNLVGQKVFVQPMDATSCKVNMNNLLTGVYNLKIKIADGLVNKKVIVN